jgi:hypothetical protein
MRNFAFVIAVFLAAMSSQAASDELQDRLNTWERLKPYLCEDKHPSKKKPGLIPPCDDGDMTLFNGLLCFTGDERGCTAVAEAQDPRTGEWHRSPRIRLLGKNDRGEANFSPDMALGVQLYLLRKRDMKRAQKWIEWLHKSKANPEVSREDLKKEWEGKVVSAALAGNWDEVKKRTLELGVFGLPWFCQTPDCVIRPGDYAILSATLDYFHREMQLDPLPDGPLRGNLGSLAGYGPIGERFAAEFNAGGFPLHTSVLTHL